MKLNRLFFTTCAFSAIFMSCQDEPVADKTLPVVTSTFETEKTYLRGVADLTIAAADNGQISKIEIFVDDLLFKNIEVDQNSFEQTIRIDTKEFSDGQHTVRVVVTDVNDNTTESVLEVTVWNYLMTFHIGPQWIFDDRDYWCFISDDDGKTIGVEKFKNDTTIVFPVPDGFEQESFTLSFFEHSSFDNDAGAFNLMNTYLQTKPGERFLNNSPIDYSTKGQTVITIENIPESYQFEVTSLDVNTPYGQRAGTTLTLTIDLRKNTADLWILLFDPITDDEKYVLLKGAALGAQTTLQFSALKSPPRKVISIPGGGKGYSFQYGYWSTSLSEKFVPLLPYNDLHSNFSDTDVRMIDVDDFSYYYTQVSETRDNVLDSYIMYGTEVPSERKVLNAMINTVDVSGDQVILQSTGTYDMTQLSFRSTASGNVNNVWGIIAPGTNALSFTKPQVPAEILSAHGMPSLQNMTFEVAGMYEFSEFNSYDQYTKETFESTTRIPGTPYEILYKSIRYDEPATGGRKKNGVTNTSFLPEHLKRLWHPGY